MTNAYDAREALARLGATGDDFDLAEAALAFASLERPGVGIEPYNRHLTRLCKDVSAYAGRAPDLPLQEDALRQVLCRRYGYGAVEEEDGDESDDDGSNLMHVIDRRSGRPVALGIIFLHAARSQGWHMDALDFAPRFVVRLEHGGHRVILDPCAGAHRVSPADLRAYIKATMGNDAELTPEKYRVMSNREVVLRLANRTKVRQLRAERLDDALITIEAMLLIAPDVAPLWREAGLLHARLDNVRDAVAALEQYFSRTPVGTVRYRTSVLLQELRGRLN